jgi:hypothetical protein
MGTAKTRKEKIEWVKYYLDKAREEEKSIKRDEFIAKLMISKECSKKTADEIIESFILSGEIKEINGELFPNG